MKTLLLPLLASLALFSCEDPTTWPTVDPIRSEVYYARSGDSLFVGYSLYAQLYVAGQPRDTLPSGRGVCFECQPGDTVLVQVRYDRRATGPGTSVRRIGIGSCGGEGFITDTVDQDNNFVGRLYAECME
jgi:hypothetical protein